MLPKSPLYTNAGAKSIEAEVDELVKHRYRFPQDGIFTQWDGTKGTCQELMDRMLDTVKRAADEPAGKDWVKLGSTQDITREYHVGRTAQGNGNRFFRYRGVLKTQPDLLCCALLDPTAVGAIDHTLRHCRVLHDFPDGRNRLVMVVAEAGPRPLFYDRDDCDLTCYYPPTEQDKCWYQVSVTVPGHLPSVSTAVRNHTMVWGYRFEPFVDPQSGETFTNATLISQTEIFGWVPKFSVNAMVSPILCEYLRKLEKFTRSLSPSQAQALLKDYGLSRL
ncbi:hypothetical protein BASA81_012690 [Batrachochytrium salamandrivorans]|nr:hypothetical protein BASA81_012690 [Batrachochytrium salamandrivorans]